MNHLLSEKWDSYWTETLADPVQRTWAQKSFGARMLMDYLPMLRERGCKRLLLPGNGCSLLPHALLHVGFQVWAVDFSQTANKAAAVPPALDTLTWFFPENKKKRKHRVDPKAVPGGAITFITEDILQWEPEEPFDAIFDDRMMMVLRRNDWPEMARCYSRWLNPGGVCLVHTINFGGTMGDDVSSVRDPFESAFLSAGFREFVYPGQGTPPPPEAKVVDFIYGSG